MKESLFDARNELRRVDHQIYVSLKYTRTVDVLMNTVKRMIDSYTCLFDSLLKLVVEKRQRPEEAIPFSPIERGSLVKELFPDEIAQKHVTRYFMLRKLTKVGSFKREQEFRRHVAMKTFIDDQEVIINIDILTEFYQELQEFYEWTQKKISS